MPCSSTPSSTWQEHLKKCAKEWHEMKKAKKNPPKVPKRIRGKQTDANRDLN